ncbi:hypothetical protein ALP65_04541, partial [Pseudomonas aeruginosa]
MTVRDNQNLVVRLVPCRSSPQTSPIPKNRLAESSMEQSSHFSWRYPLALAAVLVLSACGKAPETTQGMAAPKVSVAEVIEQPLNEWDEFTGRLEAPESVELRPRVSGYIDRVAFHEGALVKKGDLL